MKRVDETPHAGAAEWERLLQSRAPGVPPVARLMDSTRTTHYVWLAVIVYAALICALASMGVYIFVIKTLLLPWLVLLGVNIAGARTLIRDWAVPLGVIVLFDSARGWIYSVVLALDRPVYSDYVIAWEQRWFGAIVPLVIQNGLRSAWLDRLAVTIHATHFVFFVAFGFVLWTARRDAFRAWAAGLYVVLVAGLIVYLLVPTMPPWMAAWPELDKIGPVERIAADVYTHQAPTLVRGLDINPIAAMPSLHVALPAYCVFVSLTLVGWLNAIALLVYLLLVVLAALYLGEHYAVDVVAGICLAWLAFLYQKHRRRAAVSASTSQGASVIVIAITLMASAIGLSIWSAFLLRSL